MSHLPITPPFDFRHTLTFLSGFAPAQGEQTTDGELRRATRVGGQTVGFVVRQDGAELEVTLHPERPLSPQDEAALRARIAFFLATEVDLRPFYALPEQDQAFRPVIQAIHGFHQPRFLAPFEAACWAVITQRLPGTQARRIKRALSERCGEPWEGLPAFPEPTDLAGLSEADLHGILLTERKARAVAGLALAFQGVTTAELVSRPYQEVRAWLLGLYGIGPWSALFIMLRGLGRVERLDLDGPLLNELQKAAQPVYGDRTPAELRRMAERYGDQQGQWAIYLRSRGALTPDKEHSP